MKWVLLCVRVLPLLLLLLGDCDCGHISVLDCLFAGGCLFLFTRRPPITHAIHFLHSPQSSSSSGASPSHWKVE